MFKQVCIDQGQSEKSLYSKVAHAMLENKEDFEKVLLITNAKVPIIKFVDRETQLNFDVSFNKMDGIIILKYPIRYKTIG